MLGTFNAHSMRMPSHRGNCDDAKPMRSTLEVSWRFRCARNFEKQQKSEVEKTTSRLFFMFIQYLSPILFLFNYVLVVFCPAHHAALPFVGVWGSPMWWRSPDATFSASHLWEKIREDQLATDWLTLISVYVHVYIYMYTYIYIYTCLYNYIYTDITYVWIYVYTYLNL